MEAATQKRAAIRLAFVGTAVVLTIGMVAATVYLANPPAASVAERAEWDAIETGESYQLPTASESLTPTAAAPIEAIPYHPPAYAEPKLPPITPAVGAANPADSPWTGPVTIHNPAAFGPPEDDTLPPPPGTAPATQVATAAPLGPRLAVPAGVTAEPVAQTLNPPAPNVVVDTAGPSQTDRIKQRLKQLRAAQQANRDAAESVATENNPAHLGYTLSTNELSKRLEKEVQAAFNLGKSGAVYAARDRFLGVLRRVALAKDAEAGSNRHAQALAEGLRALNDADDFLPRGDALETVLDVASIAESHGLRLIGEGATAHEAIARYSHHAAQRFAAAAANEPAASMALYGLGKTYARLELQGDLTAGRKSAAMYRAAVAAHPENYLAANELGVRLARDGHYQHAGEVLRQAAQQPDAIAQVHANLAAVEQKLGRGERAVLARQRGSRLAQQERLAGEVSRRHGVQWVSPGDFQRLGNAPVGPAEAAPAQRVATATLPGYPVPQPSPAPQPSGFSGFVENAKRALGWEAAGSPAAVTPVAGYGPPAAGLPQRVVR